jgi:hypothetical protein
MRSQARRPDGESHPRKEMGAKGGDGVGEQIRIDFSASVADQIAILYNALQAGVDVFGGIDAIASETKKSAPLTRLKIFRRPDSKGDVQKSTLDLLAHVVADPHARAVFLGALLDSWGFKPAEPKTDPNDTDMLRAVMLALDAAGDLGDDVRKRAAKAGGFDPAAFRRRGR